MVKATLQIYCLLISLYAAAMTATVVILSRPRIENAAIEDCNVKRFNVLDRRGYLVNIRFYTEPLQNGGYIVNAITEEDRCYNNGSSHGTTIFRGNELIPNGEPTPARR